MNTLTLHTLTLCLLPAVEATIVFGHLDCTTWVFNTGRTPHCLLMQSKKREVAVTRCSLSLMQEHVCSVLWSYWKPVRQTGTMKTLPAASSSCPWCSESKLSSTVWPLLLWCMMGLFSWTFKTVSVPLHPANERTSINHLKYLKSCRSSFGFPSATAALISSSRRRKKERFYFHYTTQDRIMKQVIWEFRSLTAWEEKLLCSLVIQQQILLYLSGGNVWSL